MSECRCEMRCLAEARHENVNPKRTRRSRSARSVPQPAAIEGKAKAAIHCRLCRETIVLESNFRPTAATCPHCGLKFVFDPQQEPLPVRGLRLRYWACWRPSDATVQHSTGGTMRTSAQTPASPTAGDDALPGMGRRSGSLVGCGHDVLRRLVSSAAGPVKIVCQRDRGCRGVRRAANPSRAASILSFPVTFLFCSDTARNPVACSAAG